MYFLHILPSTIWNTILLSGSSSLIVWIIVERELLQLMCCLPMQWTDNLEILTLQLACCCNFLGLVRIFSRTLSCYLRLVDVYGPSEWFFCMFCTSPCDSNLIVIWEMATHKGQSNKLCYPIFGFQLCFHTSTNISRLVSLSKAKL